MEDLKEDRNV